MHTHLEQWAADDAAPGEQSGVRCLAQGSHLSRGQFLPEPRFEPPTLGYKSNALSIRPADHGPPGQLQQQSVCITKELLHKLSETISGKLICMLVVLIGVSTWLQFVTVSNLSGKMLTFYGIWHFGEVFTDQSPFSLYRAANSVYGVVWLSG